MKAKNLLLLFSLFFHFAYKTYSQIPGGQVPIFVAANEPWIPEAFPAILKLPIGYNSGSERYPLIVFLHGTGEAGPMNGTQLSKIYNSSSAGGPSYFIAQNNFPDSFAHPVTGVFHKFITLSPQAPGWSSSGNQLKFIINDMVARYRIDTNRIYITGLSAGGQGIMDYASHNGTNPVFKAAAMVPMSAATTATQPAANIIVADSVKAWGFGSLSDSHGATTQNFMNYMNIAQPGIARFTSYSGGHCCWNNYYNPNYKEVINGQNINIYQWMLLHSRAESVLSAEAGPNQSITLPISIVTLSGSATAAAGQTITSYSWTKLTGPAGATITSPSTASTTVTSLVQGTYTFQLTVTESSNATATDTVQVTVNAAANQAPTANAGVNQTIQLPLNTVTLSGSGTDVDGTIAGYQWTKITGPAATIVSPTQASTVINSMLQGVYQFELVVTDNQGAVGKDTVQVTVNAAANQAPTANAGVNQTIQLPLNTVTLSGSGTDVDGTIAGYQWTKITGPAATIVSPTQASTVINSMLQGVYQFELVVTDNQGAVGKDTVQVTVNAAANQAPTANAGVNQTIQLPLNTVTLSGSGTDVDGTIAGYQWTKITGPAATIVSPTQASTVINSMLQGVYQFELVVTDNQGAVGKDTVQVTVNAAANQAPTANAGVNQTIQLPLNTVTLSGSGTDVDGTIAGYQWTKITGPAATIVSPTQASTVINSMLQGVYQFELVVTDNQGAVGKDTVQVTVNAAANQAPTANAGVNQTIQLPLNTVTLSGSGTDVDGTIAGYQWTKITGPAATIVSPTQASTVINSMLQGVYQFELVVTDNQGAVGKDTVQVTVNAAANQAPTANAGVNQTIQLPLNTVTLSGSGTDVDGTIAGYQWTKITGPAATIVSPTQASTVINSMLQGVYQFELVVTDNQGAVGKDTVQVTVNAAANQAPTANAGVNQTIQLPLNTVTLSGSGTDVDGTIAGYQWTKITGPAATIVSPTQASTVINSMLQGVYQFELVVTDNQGAVGKDTVQVTVNAAANQAPTANAGVNQTIQLPLNTVTLSGSGSVDPDGTIASYLWSKVSGPTASITLPASVSTTVTGLIQGLYVFQLIVTDNQGASDTSSVSIIVNSAPNSCNGVRRVLTHEVWGAALNGNIYTYSPGDTLVVRTSDGWNSLGLVLENFHGTANCPVVVINEGGQTPLGAILLRNCTNMKVTGSGSSEFYGFYSNGAFSAIDIDGRSANIEIERWKITNAGYIIRAKQDGTCEDSLNYPNWYMDNISFHDTWSRNINQDGIYFGNTAPATGRPIVCNGVTVSPIPMRLSNVSIYNNYIDSCGRTGIQLSGCDRGSNNIYNNIVRRTGFELNQTQGSGIIIGGMAYANVYNNITRQTFQYGILSLGSGFSRIENNDIDSSGFLNGSSNPGYDFSIACNALFTFPLDSSMIWIKNNKVDNNDANNIITGSSAGTWVTSGNIICGNTKQNGTAATIYLNGPGFAYSADCSGTNQPPRANAGISQTIILPINQIVLNGSQSYDPEGGAIASYSWTRLSGPNSPAISSPLSSISTVSGLVQGTYVFRLTVTDSLGLIGTGNVTIIVNAAGNQAPTANAGLNQNITLPTSSVTLNGSGTDPDGTIAGYQWTKIAGPAATIVSPTQASTVINSLVQGVYQFELRVTDNQGAVGRDTVQVTVNAAGNQAPTANAGLNQNITLPTSSVTLNGSGTDPDGTIAGYQWTKIAGPAATIVSPTQASTVINSLVQGVYQFELRVTDNQGAVGRDTVQVTVNAAGNQAPTANAGLNQNITLPTSSVTLNGSGTDPDGTIAGYQWTKIAGPAATIVSPTQASTVINSLVQGVYQFELRVTDNQGAVGRDTVQVTVNAAGNQAPTANAGLNQNITLPTSSVTLNGSGTDPDGTIAGYQWTKIAGPAATIVSPTQASTVINSLVQGVYQFELRVTDNQGAVGRDTVQVTVNAAGNQAPTANAGLNQNITLPTSSVTLNGSGTDPDGTIAGYQWTKIAGPAATIVSPTQASTVINSLVQGVYQFELRVTDNQGAVGRDTVQVTVNAAGNQAPTANAGLNQNITLPTSSVTLNGSGTDPDGTIAGYQWTKIAGPAATIVSPTQASTVINSLVQGVYQFELRVTDNQGAVGRDTVQVTVNAAGNQAPTVNAGNTVTISLPLNSVTLKGTGTDLDGSIVEYNWVKIAGPGQYDIVSPNSDETVIKDLVEGDYLFQFKATDNNGASGMDTILVVVKGMTTSGVSIFPNPATDIINLKIAAIVISGPATVSIYDMSGKILYKEHFVTNQSSLIKQINVSGLKKGMYLVNLNYNNKAKTTIKIIKQ